MNNKDPKDATFSIDIPDDVLKDAEKAADKHLSRDKGAEEDDFSDGLTETGEDLDFGDGDSASAGEEASLKQELAETKERFLRQAADFENYRKRVAKDREELRTQTKMQIMRDMLPVLDNLERALAIPVPENDYGKAINEGLQMVYKLTLDVFNRQNVKPFESLGLPFDPNLMEAVSQVPNDQPRGMVIEQNYRGYMFGEHLLRPAMVVVSSGPPQADAEEGDE